MCVTKLAVTIHWSQCSRFVARGGTRGPGCPSFREKRTRKSALSHYNMPIICAISSKKVYFLAFPPHLPVHGKGLYFLPQTWIKAGKGPNVLTPYSKCQASKVSKRLEPGQTQSTKSWKTTLLLLHVPQ